VNKPSDDVANELMRRIRRIEGQAKGVQRMLSDGRNCGEILQQLKAIESATANAKKTFMLAYAKECLMHAPDEPERERLVEQIIRMM
jgi:DNA-binding FrmR family transcriptional regulator